MDPLQGQNSCLSVSLLMEKSAVVASLSCIQTVDLCDRGLPVQQIGLMFGAGDADSVCNSFLLQTDPAVFRCF